MEEADAVRAAIGLMRVPSRLRQIRSEALPDGITNLLRIAAGDRRAEREAAESTGASPAVIRDAAAFYIEQILLAPDSDHYRTLGASPDATNGELRRNMALLLRGMHPDIEDGMRSLFAHRVISAWSALKTADRRAAYDVAQQRTRAKTSVSKKVRRLRLHKRSNQRREKRASNGSIDAAREVYRFTREGFIRRLVRLLLARV